MRVCMLKNATSTDRHTTICPASLFQRRFGYEDVPLDREFFRGKDVMILGKGNAAFELANSISAASSSTAVVSRSELRLA